MPSTPSDSVLFEKQAAGENLNTWGAPKLNAAMAMIEAAGHGLTEHTLTANKSLTYTNYTLTDGSDYVHKIAAASDSGYTITLAGYERAYLFWNASSYTQTVACSGGGTSVSLLAGEVAQVYCDSVNVIRLELRQISGGLTLGGVLNMSTNKITNVDTPTSGSDGANKDYVDGVAFNAADLPGQNSGTTYASVTSDGSTASWAHDIQPEVISTAQTLVSRRQPYYADLSGGAFTLTLPASPSTGDIVRLMTDDNASANFLTVARNGQTIGGAADDLTINLNGFSCLLFFSSSDWKVVAL